jgi:ribosomal RNA assembly protein
MNNHTLDVDIHLVEGFMEINTTKETFDPFIIIKGRDCLTLIARSVPFEQAIKVMRDEIFIDTIKADL